MTTPIKNGFGVVSQLIHNYGQVKAASSYKMKFHDVVIAVAIVFCLSSFGER